VLTVQTGSTLAYSGNTDPGDAGRYFTMENTNTGNTTNQFAGITLQIAPTLGIGAGGRVLGDIRLVRTTTNTNSFFLFSAFRSDSTYKDYLILDYTGATFSAGATFSGQTFVNATGIGNAATLKINNSSAATFNHSIEAFTANMTTTQTNIIVLGKAGTTKNSGYLGYNWTSDASNSNYVSLGHWGNDNLLRVYADGSVYMGTVTTGVWNGSSISTTYTAAKVTSVVAGTGVSVSATTGDVTVSIGQSVATSASPTFADTTLTGGLTIGGSLSRGTYTAGSNYVTGADNIVLKGNASGVSGIFFESEKDGTNINHPSDFGFIQFFPYGIGGSTGESNRLVIGVSNDADDMIVMNPVDINGLKLRVGTGTTEYTIYHSGNASYSTTYTSVTSVTVTHNLGTKNVMVMCYDSSDAMFWPSSIVTTDTNTVTITFASSRTGRVVITR
jgi:hypothetical protein